MVTYEGNLKRSIRYTVLRARLIHQQLIYIYIYIYYTVTGISLDRFSLGNNRGNRSKLIPVTYIYYIYISYHISYDIVYYII